MVLKNEANANAGGKTGHTALHAALACDHLEITRLLLDYGADIDALDETNATPLDVAATCGKEAIVRFLLDNGAIVYDKTLEAASNSGNGKVHKLILNAMKPGNSRYC